MASEVYFADMSAKQGSSLLDKVEKLYLKARFDEIVAPKDLVAIKIHFGEPGNTAYIRPQFVRRIVNKIKAAGGKPFLTDANTLYVGGRSNAVDHLQTAVENGFPYSVVDAPLVIADGLNGKDYVMVEVNQKHCKEVNIGSAIYHADAIIGVTHFKGHELTGFGGVIKNIGMGSGSRSGKQVMHADVLPRVRAERCKACNKCVRWCPSKAITIDNKVATINAQMCIGCGECVVTCPNRALSVAWKNKTETNVVQEKMTEFAQGVLKGKEQKCAFINFVMGVSPDCDCAGWNDAPIVGDIGILASRDPVAIDQACYDLVNAQRSLPNSRIGDCAAGTDKFYAVHEIDGTVQLDYAEKIGLGTRAYELIKIE
ncbi:MAG: DUF362 domain-containing protein [Bacillota bacterium]